MLDVRPTAYICPIAEQVLDDITPVIQVTSIGDEDAKVTGLVHIYRQTTDQLLYTSELATTIVTHGTVVNIAALSAWSPPAPADDDYFIMVDTLAESTIPSHTDTMRAHLGTFEFDIKTGPMGPAPAGHHPTHEAGGMDEIDLTDLVPLDDYQLLSEKGIALGYPELDAAAMVPTTQLGTGAPNGTKYLRDDQSWQVPPTDHARQHDITDTDDHTSGATPGQILQADANGLPVDATNTNADVADAVTKRNCRANGEASNATPAPNADTTDLYYLTALAEAATFGAPTGSPVNGQKLAIRILDNGTARALSWDAGAGGYIARGALLPTTTIQSKYLYAGFIYNATASKWDCVGVAAEL
jgi:hypothetical protein